jgi:hypothetical protein
MSDLSSARLPIDEAQIREGIISSLRDLGLDNFPGQGEAAREAAFEKFLTDTLVPIVFQINCYDEDDPKKVAQALKKLLEKNVSSSSRSQNPDSQRFREGAVWLLLAFMLACVNQVGFFVLVASMPMLSYSLDRFSKLISGSDLLCDRLFKAVSPVLIGLGVGFLILVYSQDSIESALCSFMVPDDNEPTDDPGFDRTAWCREHHPDWLRTQVYATVIGLTLNFQAFCFCLLSVNCKFNRSESRFAFISRGSDLEVASLIAEFSASTSFQGYLNAAQEEPGGDLRDAKFKMVKEMLKAICENLDPQIFQVVPVVPQNPLSINPDQLSVRLVEPSDLGHDGFGAGELSRGLLRETNNAHDQRSVLVFNPLTSSEPMTPSYQLSQG